MLDLFARRLCFGLRLATLTSVGACAGGNSAPPAPSPLASAASDSAHVRSQARGAGAARPGSRAGASVQRQAPSQSVPSRQAPSRAAPAMPAIDSSALERAVVARFAYRPLALALARRTPNPKLADRAAAAVVREAERLRMSPSVLGAVLLIENRRLDSSAVSRQGAVGLMQVMPMHAGGYGCGSRELREVDTNICHGARLLHRYIVRTGSLQVALRRYNGCLRGANTPRCERYPARVLRTASRLRQDMLGLAAEKGFMVPASVSLAPSAPSAKAQVARARS